MAHPHRKARPTAPKAPPSPYVQVTILFRDRLDKPIEGLDVQIKAGAGAPPAPAWKLGLDEDQAPPGAAPASTPTSVSTPDGASEPTATPVQNVTNEVQGFTDKDGYATSIQNAARNQPVDVLVKNRHGEYVLKATIVPKKDYSAFRILSSEYHVEATTKLTPKESFEQDIKVPVVKEGEVMTIERLVREFGPYIGWSQKVTEQGQIKKHFTTKHRETVTDEKSGQKKTKTTIEHHYRVVDTGKPSTVILNILGSKLNYPSPSVFSESQYKNIATELNVEIAAVKAIVQQESGGKPFLENGLPPILYERGHFFDLSVKKIKIESGSKKGAGKKKNIANPYPRNPDLCLKGSGNYGAEGLHQYEKLVRAAALDFDIAIQACSWGGFQILGEYYSECGCSTAFEFANKFMSGTEGQVQIFIAFMKNIKPGAVQGLRQHNWGKVAESYNGIYWQSTNPDYAENLKIFYEKFK
ncbi:N-acetylmuramidase family protein [Paraburkholderia tropica]|uniref:N-acetylmuramidase family protein n=1 Tax=Paraburkholderia tropica TaxID=92647 RepID=UPI002AB62C81|nr:N-acetylmuramidase family protein [Paraburkholderia tropica]